VLEAGGSCGALNYRYRRVGESWADHNGRLCGTTANWDRGDFRCRDKSRIVAATLRHRALAVGEGNSEIINARCAERPVLWMLDPSFPIEPTEDEIGNQSARREVEGG
jgi:hypothetical protein